ALVAAALTIISAYLQSPAFMFDGCVADDITGSFEHWDTLARQPIAWLAEHVDGLTDPKQTLDANVATDPEQEALAAVLNGVYEWQGSTPFKARELLDYAGGDFNSADFSADDELKDALAAMCGGNGVPSSVGLGKAVAFRRDRIADGFKLTIANKSTKGTTFKVVRIDE